MKIGIPRGLFYYYYSDLLLYFFEGLKIKVVLSPKSSKEILNAGSRLAPSEACSSLKMFIGHVNCIKDRCDYVLIPCIRSVKKNEKMCTNFLGLYDLVNNIFDIKLLSFVIDENNLKNEKRALIKLGISLGYSYKQSKIAYENAKNKEIKNHNLNILKSQKTLGSNNRKVLLAGHSYNLHDEYFNRDIIKTFKDNNIDILYSDILDNVTNIESVRDLYFTYSKNIMSSAYYYKNYVDGIVLISSFPCGIDSMYNEILLRDIDIPIINISFDENSSSAGLITRLESFIDIINKEDFYGKNS